MKHSPVAFFLAVFLLTPWQAFGATPSQTPSQTTSAISPQEKPYALETIVVTAKKIAIDKQAIAANLTVFSDQTIEDLELNNLERLANFSPNVSISKVDNFTNQVVFRGIGGIANMNKVWNINLDGVIVPYVAINTLLDVERVEILRGAQGALYGRNTHAGAINIVTRDPGTEANGYATINYESYNTFKAQAAAGGPINDALGYRLAVAYEHTDGYFTNDFLDKDDTNDADKYTVRGKLVFTPEDTSKFTLNLNADSYTSGFDSFAMVPDGDEPSLHTTNNIPGYNDGHLISPSLTWEKEFDSFNMISISNYSNSNYNFLHDWDFTQADIYSSTYDEDFNTISQELRFSGGNDSNFQWLVGFFGLIEKLDTETETSFGADAAMFGLNPGDYVKQNSTIDTTIVSTFGQVIYKPFSKLELTGAVRLDYEQKDLDWINASNTVIPTARVEKSEDWLGISPSASAAWLFTEDQQVYASVARGFKAGDFNNVMVEVSLVEEAVDPEYTMTYEIGYKGRYFNDRLETNLALFYIEWDDMQMDIQDPNSMFNNFQKVNAGKAHSSGIEIETRAILMPGWEMFANVGYMFEYEIDDFQRDATTNWEGNTLPNINQYSISLGSIYRTDFGLFVSATVGFYGRKYLIEDNTAETDPYTLVNAKIGYEAENWELYFYGRNLLDERYATTSFGGAMRAAEPLVVGTEFTLRF